MAKTAHQNRHKARILAMQAIFQFAVRPDTREERTQLLSFNWMDYALAKDIEDYARAIINATLDNIDTIDDLITERLVGWEFSRISPVSRALLRIGIAQIVYLRDTETPIVIDECLQLAKKYDDIQSAAFINAILDQIARRETDEVLPEPAIPRLKEKIRLKKKSSIKKSDPA